MFGLTIAVLFFIAALYGSLGFKETKDDRVRFVTFNGYPKRVLEKGWAMLLVPFEEFYDYTKALLTINLKDGKVATLKTATADNNFMLVNSEIYFFLISRGSTMVEKFKQASKLWKHGLKPERGQMLTDGDDVKSMFEMFVIAMQREVAKGIDFREMLTGNRFVDDMTKVLNSSSGPNGEINPFAELGITNIRYAVSKLEFTNADMEKSMFKLAIAREEGEAEEEEARHKAIALNEIYTVIEQHPQAATLRTIEQTGNHWVLTFDPSTLPKMLGGAK